MPTFSEQYADRIDQLEEEENEELVEVAKKERDAKIADIQKNFDDDAHIEAKIRAEKSKVVDQYMQSLSNSELWGIPFSYQFTDVETGESYSSGNLDVPAAYKRTFNGNNGLFRAGSISSVRNRMAMMLKKWSASMVTVTGRMKKSYVEPNPYNNEVKKLAGNTFRMYEGTVIVPKRALKEGNLGARVSNFNFKKYLLYAFGILGALALTALLTKFQFKKEWATENKLAARYDKLKIDIKLMLLIISFYMMLMFISVSADTFRNYYRADGLSNWIRSGFMFGVLVCVILLTVFQLVNLVERVKNKKILEQDMADSYMKKGWIALQEMFLKKSIGVQTFILLIGFFLAGIGLVVVVLFQQLISRLHSSSFILGLPALYMFLRRSAYLNRIIISTEKMAQGRLT